MNGKNILKVIGIGAAAVGLTKVGELYGFFKGTVQGCRIAEEYPDTARQIVEDADGIKKNWTLIKEELKNRRA